MFMFTEHDEQHAAASGYATLGPRRRTTCCAAELQRDRKESSHIICKCCTTLAG